MTEQIVIAVINGVVVLIGAGAGSYWGLKASLNGLRETTKETKQLVSEVRDDVKHIKQELD